MIKYLSLFPWQKIIGLWADHYYKSCSETFIWLADGNKFLKFFQIEVMLTPRWFLTWQHKWNPSILWVCWWRKILAQMVWRFRYYETVMTTEKQVWHCQRPVDLALLPVVAWISAEVSYASHLHSGPSLNMPSHRGPRPALINLPLQWYLEKRPSQD